MKTFLTILAVLALVIAVLGFIAPKDFKLEREIVINKPNAQVFSYIKLLENHLQWNSWLKKDPNVKHQLTGTDGTVGATLAWQSDNKEVGHGEQSVNEVVEGQKLDTNIHLINYKVTFRSYFLTTPLNDTQTKVVMGMENHLAFPCNVICLVMNCKKQITTEFDKSLNDLKTNLEK